MAQEQKANNAQSTLAGELAQGATTLTVVSAAKFPTVPQFRVIIDSEIVLVTAVAGAVFTGTRGAEGTTDVLHGAGSLVTLIETEEGQIRFRRDFSNPLWGLGQPMQLFDSSGTVLTAASFSDVNMTNASKADVTGGSILMKHDSQAAANDFALIVKAAPSVPWTVTVGFIPNLSAEGASRFPSAGVVVHENASGEFYDFFVTARAAGILARCTKFDSPTAAGTAFLFSTFSHSGQWSMAKVAWLRIEDNNTNLIFSFSTDGVHFLVMGQEARTTFLTPDEIGFAVNNFGNTNSEAMATIVSWDES